MRSSLRRLAPLFLVLLAACGKGGAQGGGGFSVRVVVAEAKVEDLSETLPLVGTLAANEAVELRSEIDGQVEAVGFQEGEEVRKGRWLFKIDERKLQAELDRARAAFRLAEANLRRAEALLKDRTISQQEHDQTLSRFEADKSALALADRALEDATIVAPFDGAVGARLVSPGQLVVKGQQLSSLIDPDPIKVESEVPERFAGRLSPGMKVRARVASFPEEGFDGIVYFVSPQVRPETRTVQVKARLPNPEGRLQPGMFANLELVIGVRKGAVVVPESALLRQGEAESVFVVDAQGRAEARPVLVGLRLPGRFQVLQGVRAGEKVIVEGTQKLGPGLPVTFDAPGPPAPAASGG